MRENAMKANTIVRSCGVALLATLAGAGLSHPASATEFRQTNLVSDISGIAQKLDSDLVNPWGIAEGPNTPLWVADNGTGLASVFPIAGSTVTVGPTFGTATMNPTGQVYNGVAGFFNGGVFLFASEDGIISGWNGGASAVIDKNNSASGAVYKGLAIDDSAGNLYVTNFHSGNVEMYNSSFGPPKTFTDPGLKAQGYAPFNVQIWNGKLYVTFAKQDPDKHDDVAGAGHGFIDVFNLDGTHRTRLVSHGALDSPWGMQVAPSSFGAFAGALLVGNFGNGLINAYNPLTGAFEGTLDGTDGKPIDIDGLWGLQFGNGTVTDANTLFFTAGPDDESHGLFGDLTVTTVPELSTWAMLALGFGGLGVTALRRRKATIAMV
jgi:uncharacterized protein (TIGR03118 family)